VLTLLNPWSRVLLEKLSGSQLVKKFPHFMETEGSQPDSQVVVVTYCAETRVINQSAAKKNINDL
jgi:hypothetical protein